MEGILIKRYGGFYYVASEGKVWICRLRGKFRRGEEPLPGDRVYFTPLSREEGVIEGIGERRVLLERPTVANVDQAVLVFSLATPPPDLQLLDRLLFLSAVKDLECLIVWNKADIAEAENLKWPEVYTRAGYRNLMVSALTGEGLEELKEHLKGKISTLAGPSGAGKTSLLNALFPHLNLPVGELSAKLGRGRHTTRHVELLPLPTGGWVADTPGFSRLNLPRLAPQEVARHFKEMEPLIGRCRFKSCLHRSEPGCAVREAVEAGLIAPHRYEHYLDFLEEIMEMERRYP